MILSDGADEVGTHIVLLAAFAIIGSDASCSFQHSNGLPELAFWKGKIANRLKTGRSLTAISTAKTSPAWGSISASEGSNMEKNYCLSHKPLRQLELY
jgi:hypothetical protein